ncbi:MAG: heterodisulfide reductase-related iron-sulfur binding cluster [Firmicutes bacterium]|nr:heterodisulfide reductase-related iron-sulfur binding cluster [Bacillota bacterium]
MQFYYEQFDTCREHDIPMCADACPFKVDFLDFQERITGGRINAAYKSLRDKVVFPEIVCEVCPGYCEEACIRQVVDSPVRINMLEKSVIALATRKTPNSYNLPAKKQRIGVIGAGLSGMGFAHRMATKKYPVTIFEREDYPGGSLSQVMDRDIYMEDFSLQFGNEKYELKTGTEIDDIRSLCLEEGEENPEKFNVIYVATGAGGADFGIGDEGCMKIGDTAVFLGGEVRGHDRMHALAEGLNLSASAEDFLKIGKLEYYRAGPDSRCVANRDHLEEKKEAVSPAGESFTEEECKAEASRCIRCSCDACESLCDIVGFFDKWPAKMRDEIFLSCKPAGSLVHKSPARRYIAACTDCGLLTEACPESIDLCGMVKLARHKMHEADKVPAAYKQYYIRDMEFADSEECALDRVPGGSTCSEAFFPGCNLGALNPEYVIKPYKWLLEGNRETGLLLRCCGIPANWNGNEEQHDREIADIRAQWEGMGRPKLIMACMSCMKHFAEYLPEIETVSLYEVMAERGGFPESALPEYDEAAVFDPCSARGKSGVQEAVRKLASGAGMKVCELPKGDVHGCCGFGGNGTLAAKGFSDYVADKRASLSDKPYIVYCSNCRDVFTDRDKEAVHILDILFGINEKNSDGDLTLSGRRANRIELKNRLLAEIWGEEGKSGRNEMKYRLIMEDEAADKARRQKILDEDICEVIEYAEKTGRRTRSAETGRYKAYREIGAITLWVEYTEGSPEERHIYNVYSHRMQIKLEAVFNGKKIDE